MMPKSIQDYGWVGSIARFWRRSNAGDYVGLVIVVTLYIMVQIFIEPFHRMFSLDDRSISYPHALIQRVSAGQNVLYAGVGPLAIFIIWSIILRPGYHKSHVTILGLFISLMLTSLLTDIIKNSVGRPRPDLIARCKPASGTPTHELVTIDVCTETDHHTLHDGWRSFPSGHSSFSFAGLGYLALFLAGQMHIMRPGIDFARCLLALIPLIGAAMIAMSRLADYRHDVYDVTAGSSLGMACAYFSYRRYYRNLRNIKCDEPYPNEDPVTKRTILRNGRDEEQIRMAEDFTLADTDDESEAIPLNRAPNNRA